MNNEDEFNNNSNCLSEYDDARLAWEELYDLNEDADYDFLAQWGLSVAGHSMKLSKDQYTAVEEVRYIPYSSHA